MRHGSDLSTNCIGTAVDGLVDWGDWRFDGLIDIYGHTGTRARLATPPPTGAEGEEGEDAPAGEDGGHEIEPVPLGERRRKNWADGATAR